MPAQYTYLATDLVTNTVLGELPINNVSLDCQLNTPGNMTAGGKLSDPRIMDADFINMTQPGRTAFWAYRNNQIVWGGIVLSREYQSDGKALSLTGQTFECYPLRRFPRSVLGTSTLSWNYLQTQTIDQLWMQLQSISNGSIGVLPMVPPYPANDVATQLTINGYDLSTSYGDLITSVTTLQGGPDYTIVWQEDGYGIPIKQLVGGIPIGNAIGTTDLVIDYPGPIADYVYNENASSGNNQWWAVGNGTGASTLVGQATDPITLGSGYPLWEGVNNYSGVTVQSTINAHAASDLAALVMPLVTHNVDLTGDAFPPFGSYGLGDYAVVNVTDPRFPGGFTFYVRIIGWTIQPPDEGQGVEQITFVFDEATGSSDA